MKRWRRALRIAAALALLPVAGLLAAEASFRLYLRFGPNPDRDPDGTFEIYAIGGSATVGSPYARISFPLIAARALGGRVGGRPIAVHNLAVDGESIYPQVVRLRRALLARNGRNPAAVFIYDYELIEDDKGATMSPGWARAKRLLGFSQLFTERALEYEEEHDIRGVRDLAHFERWMRAAIEAARAAGALPVVAEVATNLAGVEPAQSAWGDAAADAALARGDALERAGRPAEALALYEKELAGGPAWSSYLRYRMGRCRRALGRWDEARADFRAAADLSVDPHGPTTEELAVVRRLCEELGAPLVDAPALFEREAPHGLTGDELFMDYHHPNLRGYRLLGLAFARAVAEAYGTPLAVPPPTEADLLREAGYGPRDLATAHLQAAMNILSRSEFLYRIDDRLALAERRYRDALAQEPERFAAHLGLALVDAARRGRILEDREALEWLRSADLLNGSWSWCVPEARVPELLSRLRAWKASPALIEKVRRLAPQARQGECAPAS